MLWVLGLNAEDEASERRGLDAGVRGTSGVRPDRSLRAGLTNRDTALYIYTSGTTGLPKAARIPHSRARTYMRAFAGATASTDKDRLYCVLPLYHSTGGLVGVGSVLLNGGSVILRRKFSATGFWPDVVESGATTFVYIGELCRYLVNCPPNEMEQAHTLRLAFGNGLRPDVWPEFKDRFAIPQILEFYGSTEGNVSLFNFDGRPGAIGRVPGYLRSQLNIRLIQYDVEADEPARGPNGRCIECKPGEIGEAIGQIKADIRHDFRAMPTRPPRKRRSCTTCSRRATPGSAPAT
nr:AMP-binding protein [Brevundimonas denitrificans]